MSFAPSLTEEGSGERPRLAGKHGQSVIRQRLLIRENLGRASTPRPDTEKKQSASHLKASRNSGCSPSGVLTLPGWNGLPVPSVLPLLIVMPW